VEGYLSTTVNPESSHQKGCTLSSSVNSNISGVSKKPPKDVKYLGLPLFLSTNKSKHLAIVKEKLESHVSGWKCKCLSWMGRATLIKFVAQAAPIYGMAAFKFPKKICEDMDASIRFLVES
jgi:hypothetical protein